MNFFRLVMQAPQRILSDGSLLGSDGALDVVFRKFQSLSER